MLGECRGGHAAKVELLTARQHRGRDRFALGGGEDEHEVFRWLLDDLEQSVERLAGEAVDLVEDDDLVAVASGPVLEALGELSHLLDLGVGGGIDLDHVEIPTSGDLLTGLAFVARIGRRTALAIQRLGEHPGHRRLADSPDPGEEIRLGDPPLGESVLQCRDDRLLADDTREVLWAPLPGENLIGHIEVGNRGRRRVQAKLQHPIGHLIAAPFRA